MSSVTLTLPDDLAGRVRDLAERIPRTLEIALRSLLQADAPTVDAVDEAAQFLAEEREWQTYEYAGHLIRMAKANAAVKLKGLEAR